MIAMFNQQRETRLDDTIASGDLRWRSRESIEQALDWSWKPKGLRWAKTCVPLPRELYILNSILQPNKVTKAFELPISE
jgi:hypothetical protein